MKSDLVRPAVREDLAAVAELHAARISEGFLSSLGTRFLQRLYARAVASDAAFVLVAADEHDAVVGFVAGALDTRRFYKEFLRRDALRAGLAAAPRLVTRPFYVWETLRYGTARPEELPDAEILATAVAAPAEGRGLGVMLVSAALAQFAERGAHAAHVVTAAGNDRARGMYTRAGFRFFRSTEVHRGIAQDALLWP